MEAEEPQEHPSENDREGGAQPGDVGSKADEYLAALQRLKADFDNYRRRVGQDQARWGDAAVAGLVIQLLPVVDNLERALQAAGDGPGVRQGVEMTLRQFREVLGAAGVEAMDSRGQPFDPTRHEAVARGPVAGVAAGTVAEEYRKGYLLRDQVLRPAMVKVAVEQEPGGPAAERPAASAGNEEGEH